MRRVIIGIGNPDRGDDAAGLTVARLLSDLGAIGRRSAGYELLELWDGAEQAIIVDAMVSPRAPGSVVRINPWRDPLPVASFVSTHGVSLTDVVRLALALRRLPPDLMIYGIEVAEVGRGQALSPAVTTAVHAVAREIRAAWHA